MDKILELLMSKPEMLVPVIKECINKYKPIVYDLAQEVLKVYSDYSNNTEYPAIVARTKKNMYDAYVSVGFTEDQALSLMINDNIKLMKNVKHISNSANRFKTK